jgi:hypothetical protein
MPVNALQHLGVTGFLLAIRHKKTLVDSVCDSQQIVRVDLEGSGEGRSGSHELG